MIERSPEATPIPITSELVKGRLMFYRWMAYNGRMGRIPESRAFGVYAMSLIMDKQQPIETILSEKRRGPESDYEQTNL